MRVIFVGKKIIKNYFFREVTRNFRELTRNFRELTRNYWYKSVQSDNFHIFSPEPWLNLSKIYTKYMYF